MKRNQLLKTVGTGLLVLFAIILVGCGRDVSTVESALEGQWSLTDARMNDQPLEEVIETYDDFLGLEDAEGEVDVAADFYYSDGILNIVNADGGQTDFPYEVIDTDEENDTLTLEYIIEEEDITLRLNDEITFIGEEREAFTSNWDIVDADMTTDTTDEASSPLEEELQRVGEDFALEIMRNLDFEFALEYVDDAEAPQTDSQ